jgi:hypothetical protein
MPLFSAAAVSVYLKTYECTHAFGCGSVSVSVSAFYCGSVAVCSCVRCSLHKGIHGAETTTLP